MRTLSTAVAILALLAHAPADEPKADKPKDDPVPAGKLANPTYKSWAKFPKGTVVTLKTASETAGQKSGAVMTLTLLDLTPEKAVVEMVNVATVAGTEYKSPPAKQEQKRYVDAPPGYKPDAKPKKVDGVVEEGDRTVTVAGKEYKTKYVKVKQKIGDVVATSEVWTSDDVPGMTLKLLSTVAGPNPTTTTLELVEVKKPDGKK